jgi:uncharacterized membrane protein YccC
MIEVILTLMAALVAAIIWIITQQRRLREQHRRTTKAEQRLHSAKLTLTHTKEVNQALAEEVQLLRQILTDVAKGEANVWIDEHGNTRAEKCAYREIPGYKH